MSLNIDIQIWWLHLVCDWSSSRSSFGRALASHLKGPGIDLSGWPSWLWFSSVLIGTKGMTSSNYGPDPLPFHSLTLSLFQSELHMCYKQNSNPCLISELVYLLDNEYVIYVNELFLERQNRELTSLLELSVHLTSLWRGKWAQTKTK